MTTTAELAKTLTDEAAIDPMRVAAEHAEAARRHTVARNEAIRAALTAGATTRAIAAEVGLSHTAIIKIGRAT